MAKDFSIEPYLTDIAILEQTAEQIRKDFACFSLPIHFSGRRGQAYQELYEQIYPHIVSLAESDHQKFQSLLYRIDIPESQLHAVTGEGRYQHLTNLIIKRCLQKVVLRKLFS